MTATVAETDLLHLDKAAQDLLFREARTANTFSDEPVDDAQLAAIYELVKWAPTSMNIQPLRMTVLRSRESRDRLIPHLAEGNRPKTRTAPVAVILSADGDFHENLPQVFPHKPDAKDLFSGNQEGRHATAHLNAALQVGYFILGVRAAGLAAGPMTGFDNAGVDGEFFAGTAQRSLVVVNIGKPGENPWFDRLPRLEHEQVVTTL